MSLYKPAYPVLVSRLAEADVTATNIQLAKILKVSPATISSWMEKHGEFRAAVELVRAKANSRVEEALYRKATGYKKKVQKVTKDGDVVDLEEEVPADNSAMFFWLKNRAKEDWKDTFSTEVTGSGGAPLPMINITLNTVKGQETIVPAVDMTKTRGGSVDYHKRKQRLIAENRQQTFRPQRPEPQNAPEPEPESVAAPMPPDEEAEFEDYDEDNYK